MSFATLAGTLLPSVAHAGVTPAFTLTSPATTAFPTTKLGATSAAQVITLTTTRAVTIANGGITIAATYGGYTEFALGTVTGCSTNGTTSTASGTTCSLSVTFTPKYPGLHASTLSITDTTGLVYNLGLSGLGDGPQTAVVAGSVFTLSGSAGGGYYSGDGGPAASARIDQPYNVFVDAADNVYMADYPSVNVRVIYRSGAGLACLIEIENPAMFGLATGATSCAGATSAPVSGDMYTIEGDTTPFSATVTTHATGDLDNVLATTVSGGKAAMASPYGISVDGAGDVFVSDYNDYNLRVIYAGGEATACLIEIENPTLFGLAKGVTSCAGATSAPQIGYIYTLVSVPGTVTPGHSGDAGLGTSALMAYGQGVFVTANDDVFFTDYSTQAARLPHIRVLYNGGAVAKALITAENPTITAPVVGYVYNIVGAPPTGVAASSSGDGGLASLAYFEGSRDLIIDKDGNLVFTEYASGVANKVRVVYMGGANMSALISLENPTVKTPQVGYVYLLEGSATNGYAGDGGLASAATSYGNAGVAEDPAGNLYISEEYNFVIRKITASTGLISTVAGIHTQNVIDGNALTTAALEDPWGNFRAEDGTLFFNDLDRFRDVTIVGAAQTFALPVAPGNVGTETKLETFSNTGTQPLTIASVAMNNGNFTIVPSGSAVYPNCAAGLIVAPGASCLVTVAFSPTSFTGLTGTLTVTDNSLGVTGSTHTVAFTGTAALQTAITLNTSATPVNQGTPLTFSGTVTLVPGQTIPTGTAPLTGNVTVTDTTSGTVIASALAVDVTSGTANYTTTAISTLPAGTQTIQAVFKANPAGYANATATLTQVIVAPAFSVSISTYGIAVPTGSTTNVPLTIATVGGYAGTVTVGCTNLPANVSCVATPQTTIFTGANNTVTVNVAVAAFALNSSNATHTGRTATELAGLLGAALLLFLPRRRRLGIVLVALFALALSTGLTGCASGVGGANASRGTFNINIVASDGTTTYSSPVTVSVIGNPGN